MATSPRTLAVSNATVARDWFGQPPGLTILVLTAMWELFSYFGMRTLLVYYLVQQLHFAQERASLIYGLYTGFAFFTPLLGGFVSDRCLSRYRAVVLGGSIMAVGLFLMALPALLYAALTTIVIGYGLFLTTVPSQIGGLYAIEDPRHVSAYSFWYVGVNVGALFAPLVCGTVGERFGWNWGFPLAGVGMVLGLIIYVAGRRYLPDDPPRGARDVGVPVGRADRATPTGHYLARFVLLAGIAAAVAVFRAAYEQVGNTVPLWIAITDRSIHGFTLPMTWFQSLDPLLVIAITPALSRHWARHAGEGRELAPLSRMIVGTLLTALAFLMLAAVCAWCNWHGVRAGYLWVVAFYVVFTLGELHILPVGLGLFARLAPGGLAATTLALWYFANFFGNLAAGALGTLWSHLGSGLFFSLVAGVAAASGGLLSLFRSSARRAIAD